MFNKIKIERWKWNPAYNLYVSSFGHFKDKDKKDVNVCITQNGYCRVQGSLAHRIVLKTFKPIKNSDDMTVDHLDHNLRNNSLDNLEWVSYEENQRRAARDMVKQTSDIPLISLEPMSDFKIICGEGKKRKTFDSIEDACIFIADKNSNNCDDLIKIRNKIKLAIMSQSKYFGKKWRID